jgi:hypothetical protein
MVGMRNFVECLRRALKAYRVDATGLDERDILPAAVLVADELVGLAHGKGSAPRAPQVWVAAMNRDSDRRWVMSHLRHIRSAASPDEQGGCIVDGYVFAGAKGDPVWPVLTIESEGAVHDVTKSSHSGTCDYLWDFFKLLQVPSPLRLFFARTSLSRVRLLERRLDALARAYAPARRPRDEVFAVVFPAARLDRQPLRVQRWVGSTSRSLCLPLRFAS